MYITKHWKKNIFIIQVSLIWVSDFQMCVCNLVWFCLCIPTFLQGRILCFNCICIRPRSLCICNCTLWPRRKKADRRILLRVRTRRASVIHQPNHLSQTISAKLSQPSQIIHFNHLSQTVSFPQLGNQCESLFLAGSETFYSDLDANLWKDFLDFLVISGWSANKLGSQQCSIPLWERQWQWMRTCHNRKQTTAAKQTTNKFPQRTYFIAALQPVMQKYCCNSFSKEVI